MSSHYAPGAPVVGLSMPVTDNIIATKLIHMDNVMLQLDSYLPLHWDRRFQIQNF